LHIGSAFLRFLKETNREVGKTFTIKNVAGINNGIAVGTDVSLKFTKHLNKDYINSNDFTIYNGYMCKLEAFSGQPTTDDNPWLKDLFYATIFKEFNEWLFSKFNIKLLENLSTNKLVSEIRNGNLKDYSSLRNLYSVEDSDRFTINNLPNGHMFVIGAFGVLFKRVV
jgi:hypothetical protein